MTTRVENEQAQEVVLKVQFCDQRKRDGARCGEPLFRGRLMKGSWVERRCHKCGNTTTVAA